ncbi:hypothetical protein [Candidatus Stoquefichus sp. SB1]|uniref:hypothetical protein n=1 Tax=Candidatus Stoquefichus sp. SB1 TaxID=1658109 RepID=UPI001E585DB9|nr:hypothetical protein [Candidatus Stoquefichus sp. SB1]
MANNTVENIEYEEKERMIQYMERSYEMFKADGALIRELLEEREKEFFHAMELNETRQEGKKEGIIQTINNLIMIKYNKDANKWLSQCQENRLMKILSLISSNASYESLVEQFKQDN